MRLTVGVLTPRPGSDLTEQAHFQLEGDGRIIDEVDGNLFTVSIQETLDTNLRVHVRNDHPSSLELAVFGFVTRPPDTFERFLLSVPWLLIAGLFATLWALFLLTRQSTFKGANST